MSDYNKLSLLIEQTAVFKRSVNKDILAAVFNLESTFNRQSGCRVIILKFVLVPCRNVFVSLTWPKNCHGAKLN